MIALIFVMLSHIMLFGLLIGSISELVKSGLKSLQFKEETKKKKQMISRWMKYRKLEHPIVKKINVWTCRLSNMDKHKCSLVVLQ